MVQAETLQGIGDKPGGLHRVVADFTYAVSAGLEPSQGGVHLPEQGRQLRIRTGRGNRRRDSLAALHELLPHDEIKINAQWNLLSCPENGAQGVGVESYKSNPSDGQIRSEMNLPTAI